MPARVVIQTVPDRATFTPDTNLSGKPSCTVYDFSSWPVHRFNPDFVPIQTWSDLSASRLVTLSSSSPWARVKWLTWPAFNTKSPSCSVPIHKLPPVSSHRAVPLTGLFVEKE